MALVNIVRKQEQVDLLTKLGAKFVVDSSSGVLRKICTRRLMPHVQRWRLTRRVSIRMALWITSRPILLGEGLWWVRFFTDAA